MYSFTNPYSIFQKINLHTYLHKKLVKNCDMYIIIVHFYPNDLIIDD